MISSDILLLGMAIIAGAMALALLAYALRIYQREKEAQEIAIPDTEPQETAHVEGKEAVPPRGLALDPQPLEPDEAADPRSEQLEAAAQEPAERHDPGLKAIATLLRNQDTGQILIQVGDRRYLNKNTLKSSSDWPEIELGISDLIQWLSPDSEADTISRGFRGEAGKPPSMIDEINEILAGMGAEAGGKLRGVRLIEGHAGAVRVFVGVESYDLEDVPDAEVRSFIRAAVTEWESRQ